MSGKLAGQVAIITGGGGGIGEAIALAFAREGAAVVVADRDDELSKAVAAKINKEGGRAMAFAADVTRAAEVQRLYEAALGLTGRIDILINNVGGYGQIRPTWEIDEDEWDRIIALNVKSAFLCSKIVIPAMLVQRSGRIINFSSLVGRAGGVISTAHYATGKAALRGFTWQLAAELGPHGITVNAIAPGITRTERLTRVRGEEDIAALSAKIPLRRPAETKEIADAVVFLASGAAAYITGATIDVNGGLTML